MKSESSGYGFLIAGILAGVLIAAVGVPMFLHWREARENRILYEEVRKKLRCPHYTDKDGFWVGDITENFRFGKISREVAEADTAPLNPLVPKPVPFHGYFVRAMESGPSLSGGDPTPDSFKGLTWSRDNFAIMIYPAEPGPGKSTWIMNRLSELRRSDEWTPVFRFPTHQERVAHWGIVD